MRQVWLCFYIGLLLGKFAIFGEHWGAPICRIRSVILVSILAVITTEAHANSSGLRLFGKLLPVAHGHHPF